VERHRRDLEAEAGNHEHDAQDLHRHQRVAQLGTDVDQAGRSGGAVEEAHAVQQHG
jgi:hypothetical protein